jgi:acyl-CoA synthetase (AMP-forming)/AMP-acid ligase II
VESALVEHEAVAEAAVVGHPHPVKGECLYCFVTLCDGHTFSPTLTEELKKQSKQLPGAGMEGSASYWERLQHITGRPQGSALLPKSPLASHWDNNHQQF